MNKIIILFTISLFTFACSNSSEKPSIKRGNIEIAVDESLKKIIEAQINAYKMHYPEAVIVPKYVSEQKAIAMLLQDSITIAATTRDFNEAELKVLASRKIKYQPAPMAIDATVLVVNKANSKKNITLEELKTLLTDKNSKTKLIFDNSNSSNINHIVKVLKIEELNTANIFSANGNLKVLEEIQNDPNAIGFIGFNWFSEVQDTKTQQLIEKVDIMGVSNFKSNIYFQPNLKNLKNRNYPLERFIILHTLKGTWGLENGFIRFSCAKIGQLVVEKMGLVPYYRIPKEFLLNTEPL
jgi:phosphate transport system substrate-binding protein